MKKILIYGAVAVLLLLLVLSFAAGSIVRAAVEKGAAYALGVDTSVGGASLNPLSGSLAISNLRIGNPPGFKSQKAFEVSKIGVDAKLSSLLSDTIVISKIEVLSPDVTIEESASGTNLGALRDNLRGKGAPKKPEDKPAKPMKLRVDLIEIKAPRVTIAESLVGATEVSVPLPDITMRDIGTGGDKNEVTLDQLIDAILGAIGKSASSGVAGIPQDLSRVLSHETSDSELKNIENAGKDIGTAIDSVFKKKK